MAVEMESPDGDRHDIPEAGVTALTRLGWRRVEKPRKRTARKQEG